MVAAILIGSMAVLASGVMASPISNKGGITSLQKLRNNKRGQTGPNNGHNWNGAIIGANSEVSTVVAQLAMPTPSTPPGGVSGIEYSGTAWVGIDGDASTPLWETGVFWNVQGSDITFSGWYNWCTSSDCEATIFEDFTASPGDVVSMMIVGSGSSGTAYLNNTSTGKAVNKSLIGQSGSLSGVTAEWIVEDFSEQDVPVPFASFSPLFFSGCAFTNFLGPYQNLSDASYFESIKDADGKPALQVERATDNAFTVTYLVANQTSS